MADGSPKIELDSGVRHGAPEPFAALYQQHAGMVRRALRQLGVQPSQLDDAVQDVFVVLHRRIDEFERGRKLENWLWGIARGVASGYRRSQRRRDRLHASLPAPEGPGLPERGVARREAAAILDEFLGSLDADKCAVFVLSELEGRRGPEIAEQLHVNLNTVYARLRAARQRFDDAMTDHREPARRPFFVGWLGAMWPAWLSKPAVVMGVAVATVVVTGSVPPATSSAAPPTASIIEPAPVLTVAEAQAPARWPGSLVPHAAQGGPVAAYDEPAEEILVLEAEAEPALAPSRGRSLPASASAPDPITPVESLAIADPDLLIGSPARAPWLTTVEGRRPVRHPTLLSLRQDFVAELLRVAARL